LKRGEKEVLSSFSGGTHNQKHDRERASQQKNFYLILGGREEKGKRSVSGVPLMDRPEKEEENPVGQQTKGGKKRSVAAALWHYGKKKGAVNRREGHGNAQTIKSPA